MWLSSGALILILATMVLLALTYFQVRDVLWTNRDWHREIRRYRKSMLRQFPPREQISTLTRVRSALNTLGPGQSAWRQAMGELTDGSEAFTFQVREEIDKIVGREIYQGHKEQL